jgi:hypothetical protein
MRFIETGEFRNIDLAGAAGLCIGDVGEPFQFGRKIGEAPTGITDGVPGLRTHSRSRRI